MDDLITDNSVKSLITKWDKNIQSINESYGKEISTTSKVLLASALESTSNQINSGMARLRDINESGTQLSDIGPYKKHAFELVTATVPNLVALDLVSVQPLKTRTGEVRVMQLIYGDNKGKVVAGTPFNDALGNSNSDHNYSSETVEDEVIGISGQTTYETNLMWYPLKPGTVSIGVFSDDGTGKFKGTGLGEGSSIDYQTGKIKLVLSSASTEDLLASYEYCLDQSPVRAPEVNVRIKSIPMVARNRKLKATYSFDAAYDLQNDYGYNIGTDIVAQIAAEVRHELDGEIMADLYNQAGLVATPWSATPPNGITLNDHYASFYNKIVEACNQIFDATRRVSGTFIIVGSKVANIVESLPKFRSVAAPGTIGPHLCGYLNGSIPVYKNPYYAADTYLCGYKGQGLFEAGYIHAPYIPVIATSLLMTEDFEGRRGFATSYGKKMVNPNMYVKGKVVFS